MKIVVLDCETTGLNEDAQACEVALVAVDLVTGLVEDQFSTLVRPTCPVEVTARAVHHVTDDDLADAPSMARLLLERSPVGDHRVEGNYPYKDDLLARVLRQPGDYVLVGHNAEFDRRILVQAGVHPCLLPPRAICTLRCARHLYPDAPGHSNQALKYWLRIDSVNNDALDVAINNFKKYGMDSGGEGCLIGEIGRAILDGSLVRATHRALSDARVTAAILERMLSWLRPEWSLEQRIDELMRLTTAPILLKKVWFGKHYGALWSDVPRDYLEWVLRQNFDADVKHTALYWIQHDLSRKA